MFSKGDKRDRVKKEKPPRVRFKDMPPREKRRRILSAAAIAAFIAAMVVLYILFDEPILKFVSRPETLREWVDARGIVGRLAFLGIVVIQIIIAVIPGEPVEIAAGYVFGIWEGTGLCVLGCLIGGILVFLFVRKLGIKAVEVFFPLEKINSIKLLNDEKRLNLLLFIVFFIPGTPKDILTYCAGLTKLRMGPWLLITSIARIPSIITSTIGGDALGVKNYVFAIIVFSATAVLSIAGILVYRHINKRSEEKK